MSKVVFFNLYEYSYLGTRCLASYLRKHGVETHNILFEDYPLLPAKQPKNKDFFGYHIYMNGILYEQSTTLSSFTEKDFASIEELISQEKPDIFAFSSRSTHNSLVPQLMPAFKKAAPNALFVAGGYGPTLDPDIYLDAGFDAVIRGDGEEPLLALSQALENKDTAAMLATPSTSWSKKWGSQINSLTDQKKDLSDYPAPLSGNEYFSYIENGAIVRNIDPILSKKRYYTFFGRGCTGTCSYCSGGQWWNLYRKEGKKAYKRRNRNMDEVLDEIRNLPSNINEIIFCDEYWGNSTALTKDFFTKYKEKVKRPFFAYLPYEQMVNDADLFNLILDAGLYATGIGFQTGSYEFAKKYYLRKQNYPLLLKYAHILFENRIAINPQFIGGNCYETMDDFMLTVDIVRQLPFSIEDPFLVQLQSTQLKTHPHTPLLEIAPRVITHPMSSQEWIYRAILLELARIMYKDEFELILKDNQYKENPQELQNLFDRLLFRKQYEHYKQLIANEADKRWVFFGASTAYADNKEFFKPLNPEGILIDKEFQNNTATIDNLKVFSPEDFMKDNNPEEINILVFTGSSWPIARKLHKQYNIPFANIHSCTSNWSSPFSAARIDKVLGHA